MQLNFKPCRCGSTHQSQVSFGSTDYAQYYVRVVCETCGLQGPSVRHHPSSCIWFWQGQNYDQDILAELWEHLVAGKAPVDQYKFDCQQAARRDLLDRADLEGWHAARGRTL